MSSTFSSLKFELIGSGEQSGTWGTTTNTNIGTAIEQAIVGMATLEAADFTANVCTLTLANTNAAQDARALCLKIDAAALSAASIINVPAIQKPYLVINAAAHAVTVKVSGQTGVAVPAGSRTVVYNDGTDVGNQISWLSSLTLGTALPIASGGTGATTASGARTSLGLGTLATQDANNVSITGGSISGITDLAVADGGTGSSTAAGARTNLGATTVGANLFTLPNPSAIRYVQLNADNTVTVMDAATFRAAIGAGTGGGSVSSVSGTGTVNGITLTGTVTSSGSLTLGGTLSGVSLATQVAGTLPVANGGTGATDAATARSNLGAGTVTSVAGSGTLNGLTLTGTVTGSGNLTLGGTFRFNVQVVGTNTAASANNVYVVTAASVTVTLPGSPTAGDLVGVSNMSGAVDVTIARNGNKIMALTEDLVVDLDGAGFMLIYTDATRGWVLMP